VILELEKVSAKKRRGSEISRTYYDFVFLRQDNFGVVPEYVLRTVPKRKDIYLLRGQIWVDASTFRIRRIEGVPAKSPSFWIKGIHITLQFAELGGMWGTRFLRRYRYGTPLWLQIIRRRETRPQEVPGPPKVPPLPNHKSEDANTEKKLPPLRPPG
jgi:hypothetical protein